MVRESLFGNNAKTVHCWREDEFLVLLVREFIVDNATFTRISVNKSQDEMSKIHADQNVLYQDVGHFYFLHKNNNRSRLCIIKEERAADIVLNPVLRTGVR